MIAVYALQIESNVWGPGMEKAGGLMEWSERAAISYTQRWAYVNVTLGINHKPCRIMDG